MTRTDLSSIRVSSDKDNHNDYTAIHRYAKRQIPKPDICEKCNKRPAEELSNKDHKYSIDLENWWYLCKSCHTKWDYDNGFRTHGFQKKVVASASSKEEIA